MGLFSDVLGAVKNIVDDALTETPRNDMFTEFPIIYEINANTNFSVYKSHICNDETIKKFLHKWYEVFSIYSEKVIKSSGYEQKLWAGFYSTYGEYSSGDSFHTYSMEGCNVVESSDSFSRGNRYIYTGNNNKKLYFQFTNKIPMQIIQEDSLEFKSDRPTKALLLSLDNPTVPDVILYTYYDLKDFLSKPQIMKNDFPDFETRYIEFLNLLTDFRMKKNQKEHEKLLQERKENEQKAREKLQAERKKAEQERMMQEHKKQIELQNRQNQLLDSLDDL